MGAGFSFCKNGNLNKGVYYCLMTDFIKQTIMMVVLCFASWAGENVEVKVPVEECCECQCEWNEQRDGYLYPFKSKEFLKHYRYFGGRKHICIDRDRQFLTMKDEKGGLVEFHYHFKDESVIHFCTGIWCPKDCCMEWDEFWHNRLEEEDKIIHSGHHIIYPVMPSPAPMTPDH